MTQQKAKNLLKGRAKRGGRRGGKREGRKRGVKMANKKPKNSNQKPFKMDKLRYRVKCKQIASSANAVKVQGRSESSREGGEGGVGNEGGLINAI